jgi:hypothetical protein
MCWHMNQARVRSSCSKQGKSDPPIFSGPMTLRGAVELRRGVSRLAKRCLDEEEVKTMAT